jgi:hypothetical protein
MVRSLEATSRAATQVVGVGRAGLGLALDGAGSSDLGPVARAPHLDLDAGGGEESSTSRCSGRSLPVSDLSSTTRHRPRFHSTRSGQPEQVVGVRVRPARPARGNTCIDRLPHQVARSTTRAWRSASATHTTDSRPEDLPGRVLEGVQRSWHRPHRPVSQWSRAMAFRPPHQTAVSGAMTCRWCSPLGSGRYRREEPQFESPDRPVRGEARPVRWLREISIDRLAGEHLGESPGSVHRLSGVCSTIHARRFIRSQRRLGRRLPRELRCRRARRR